MSIILCCADLPKWRPRYLTKLVSTWHPMKQVLYCKLFFCASVVLIPDCIVTTWPSRFHNLPSLTIIWSVSLVPDATFACIQVVVLQLLHLDTVKEKFQSWLLVVDAQTKETVNILVYNFLFYSPFSVSQFFAPRIYPHKSRVFPSFFNFDNLRFIFDLSSWYLAGRMGTKRNRDGRKRNARLDGFTQEIRSSKGFERCSNCRLLTHDSSNCRANRNTHRIRSWSKPIRSLLLQRKCVFVEFSLLYLVIIDLL